ncbi:hypothetical protein GGI35DRAFT_482331 [Trichoderma velutinum]
MSPSSVYSIDGSTFVTHSKNATANNQIIIVHHVPDTPTYSLDRFHGHVGEMPTDEQWPPLVFGPTPERAMTEAETEARAKERILTQLQEFDVKFGASTG